MKEEGTFATIPLRMMRRYVDNFNFLLHGIVSLMQNEDVNSIVSSESDDMFGFSKTFILLTKPGKVIALSSLDGSI